MVALVLCKSIVNKGNADEEQADAQDDANGGQDVDEKELGGEETSDKQVTFLH